MNHVHRDTKVLLSILINLGANVIVGETLFYEGVKTSDLINRVHVLKYLHGIMIFGTFEKNHEGTIWRGTRAVISVIISKNIFVHFYLRGGRFYNQYINKQIKTKYLDDDGSGVKPNFFSQNRDKMFIWLQFKRENVE